VLLPLIACFGASFIFPTLHQTPAQQEPRAV